uniref:Uncharacterized protein n=1 Tax=Anguilla anguilla TaxID=7936 RepID=A0A0E9TJY1_ANGAN
MVSASQDFPLGLLRMRGFMRWIFIPPPQPPATISIAISW